MEVAEEKTKAESLEPTSQGGNVMFSSNASKEADIACQPKEERPQALEIYTVRIRLNEGHMGTSSMQFLVSFLSREYRFSETVEVFAMDRLGKFSGIISRGSNVYEIGRDTLRRFPGLLGVVQVLFLRAILLVALSETRKQYSRIFVWRNNGVVAHLSLL